MPECDGAYAQPAATRGAWLAAVGCEGEASCEGVAAAVCPACWGCLQHLDDHHDPPLLRSAQGARAGEGAGRCELARVSLRALVEALRCGGHDSPAGPFRLAITLPPGLSVVGAAQAGALAGRGGVTVTVKAALRAALSAALPPAGEGEEDASPLPRVTVHLALTHAACSEEVLKLSDCAPLFGGGPARAPKRKWGARPPAHVEAPQETPGGGPAPEPAANAVQVAEDAWNSVVKRLAQLPVGALAAALPRPFASPATLRMPCGATAVLSRPTTLLGGYYTKELRGISQSLWLRDDSEVGNGSVAGDIEAVLRLHLRCDNLKFIGAGREDMDVRMLTTGRPFLFECSNVRSSDVTAGAMTAMEAAISAQGRVAVRCLQVLSAEQRCMMREGEAEKSKAYRAVVWLSRAFTGADVAALAARTEVVLQQQTPVRVLHRRAPLTRERTVHALSLTLVPGARNVALLDLRCAAGTYVKEFIHGDWGRTQPCLVDLLQPQQQQGLSADCLQLDVRAVEMDWL